MSRNPWGKLSFWVNLKTSWKLYVTPLGAYVKQRVETLEENCHFESHNLKTGWKLYVTPLGAYDV